MSLPVDKALRKAQSHLKAGGVAEAEELYKQVLSKFPKNKKAIQGYQKLKVGITSKGASSPEPPQEQLQELFDLYNQGQFEEVLFRVEPLILLFPKAITVYNLQGAANAGLWRLDAAVSSYMQALKIKPDYALAYNNMGNALLDSGDLKSAIESYRKAINIKPDLADAYNNMGVAYHRDNDTDSAIENYKNALKIKPEYAEAYINMGNAHKDDGEAVLAIESYRMAIEITPNNALAYNNIGSVLKANGDLDSAVLSYKKALKIKPDYIEAHNNMGVALQKKGDTDEAIESCKRALRIKPNYAEAYSNMGNSLKDKGELDAAIDGYKQALKIKPDFAEAYYNMGVTLQKKGDLEAAIYSYKKATEIKPDYAEAYYNMGITLQKKGDLGAAIDSYKQATEIKPDFAEAFNNMGISLKDKGNLDSAIDSFKQAIRHKADHAEAHLNLSLALLNIGKLKEGLDEYEWRWRTAELISKERHFPKPMWDGIASLKDKTILLWGEQGPQDMTIWSSCLPYLSSRAGHCILECPKKLVLLFARSFPNVEVKAEERSLDTERDDFDFHLPIGSLFRHFIPEISQDTKPNIFLAPDPVRVNFWRERLDSLGNGPYVGISWKSPVMTPTRLPNYTQISDWAPILSLSEITLINLQSSDFARDLVAFQDKFGATVHNFDDLDHYDNLDDVAALCAALDIVVSVSTAVSAIGAGVGTPTKLAAWRQSYWNNIQFAPRGPSVDVFERNTWEPWDNVFRSIAEDIINYKIMGENN